MTKTTLTTSFPVPDALQSKRAFLIVALTSIKILSHWNKSNSLGSLSHSLLSADLHLLCPKQTSGSHMAKGPFTWLLGSLKWGDHGTLLSLVLARWAESTLHFMENTALSMQMGLATGVSTRNAARAMDQKGCGGKDALKLSDNVSWCYSTHPLTAFRGKPSAKKISTGSSQGCK